MATVRARREFVGVRLAPDGIEEIRRLADQETDGNMSEMIRALLVEAVAARRRRGPRRTD